MINEKAKSNNEIFTRDLAGKFIKNEDELLASMTRPLTDKEKQMIENFKKGLKNENKIQNGK